MAACLFVYYRVEAAHHVPASEAVAAMFDMLRSETLEPRLMCRHDDPDTWMEVYAPADADLADRVADAAKRSGLLQYMQDGRRHNELFVDTATMATALP